ncbi:hypothetical protein GCM10010246_38790 [Streptomyces cuspidosporus]|uniref:Uncharacterized protein n=1 Tax=Streptomyces cuspidosporus TaxID=66882 RepID=A0ABP5T993_9ACTN
MASLMQMRASNAPAATVQQWCLPGATGKAGSQRHRLLTLSDTGTRPGSAPSPARATQGMSPGGGGGGCQPLGEWPRALRITSRKRLAAPGAAAFAAASRSPRVRR